MIRADFTIDGSARTLTGTTSSGLALRGRAGLCRKQAVAPKPTPMRWQQLHGNGYVDLGTYVGFTPYVGGRPRLHLCRLGSLSSSIFCVGATCPGGGTPLATTEHGVRRAGGFTYAQWRAWRTTCRGI